MKNEDLLVFFLGWLAANTPALVQLLVATVPVLALCVAAYALHVVVQKHKGGKK